MPRTAIVHEWVESIGGSEQVFFAIADAMGPADLWSLWDERPSSDDSGHDIRRTWLSRTPLSGHKAASLPLMPLVWRTQPSPAYDVVISSSHCFAHTVRFPSSRDATYLSYVHTPARYLWESGIDARHAPAWARPARAVLARADARLGAHVTAVAANSAETARRVERYWGQEASVIHPPVDVDYFSAAPDVPAGVDGDYLLAASRWVAYKGLDQAILAAEIVGLPLVVAGHGPEEARLRALAATVRVPVHFIVRPSRAQLRALYANALAFVFPAHEDFGMMPVEAQAAGTPVVGIRAGGSLETVADGVTGRLAETASAGDLAAAIEQALALPRGATMASHALQFSSQRFSSQVQEWVGRHAGLSHEVSRA
jgi:glycosyltransferase involved in cell wall biosynthesis